MSRILSVLFLPWQQVKPAYKWLVETNSGRFTLFLVILILSGVSISILSWDWLRRGTSNVETNGTTVRNIGLLLGGVIGLAFAMWRSTMAQSQAEAAQRQVEIAQQTLLNERYRTGEEMTRSSVMSTRFSGIDALCRLAEDEPDLFHVRIMGLFCTIVRHQIPVDESREQSSGLPEDVQAILEYIHLRGERLIELEFDRQFVIDLHDTHLTGVTLPNSDLSGALLDGANLTRARLQRSNLSRAQFSGADLSRAQLWEVDLSRAQLRGVDLSRARIWDSDLSRSHLGNANLSRAVLSDSRLTRTFLNGADLSETEFEGANLIGARLARANFAQANLTNANISGAQFVYAYRSRRNPYRAKGLTQGQLDVALAEPDNPPVLEGLLDAETGEQLVWCGNSPNDV